MDQVVALAQLVRAQIEAEERARRGDFAGAQHVMYALLQSIRVRGHAAVAEACDRVLAGMADEAAFAGSRGFRASWRKGAVRSASSMIDAEAAALLSRSGQKLTTAAQEEMEQRFGAGKDGAGDEPFRSPADARQKTAASRPGRLPQKRSKRW